MTALGWKFRNRGIARLRIAAIATLGIVRAAAWGDLIPGVDNTINLSTTTGTISITRLTLAADANVVNLTQDPGSTLTLTAGGLTKTGASTASISGGILVSTQSGFPDFVVNTSGGDFTISSALSGAGSALIKNGTGTLVLSSTDAVNNTFAGGLVLNQGTVRISSDLNLGADPNNANIVYFDSGTIEVAGNVAFSAGHTFTVDNVGTIAGTFKVNDGITATLGFANQLVNGSAGSAPLVKDGNGTLLIGNANSYNGPVVVNAGTLELQHTAALGTDSTARSAITLNLGAQLNLHTDTFVSGNADYLNDLTVAGNATVDVNQIATGTTGNIRLGALNLNGSKLTVQGGNRSLEFMGTTTVTGTTEISNTVDVRLGGPLTGNGSLTKSGSGTLSLSGIAPNTYADLTKVTGGVLELNHSAGSNAVPGDLTIQGGTVILRSSGQIADDSNVMLMADANSNLLINGNTDNVGNFINQGGTFNTFGGNLTVTNPGMNILGQRVGNTRLITGGGRQVDSAVTTFAGGVSDVSSSLTQGGTLSTVQLVVSGGHNTVDPGATLNIGTDGLNFVGTANPSINIGADTSTPGTVNLYGDVTSALTSGTSTIGVFGAVPKAGVLNLEGTRTFTVTAGGSAVDMEIDADMNGSLIKDGTGVMRLTGSNSFSSVEIRGGALEVTSAAALGAGQITFTGGSGSQLNIRTDSSSLSLNNALTAGDGTITIDIDINRLTATLPGSFSIMAQSVKLGSSLTVSGSPSGTLNFKGAASLQSDLTIDNTVPLEFDGAIDGVFGITKKADSVLPAKSLTFGGAASNVYVGTTTVNAGVLILNKSAGAIAVPAALVINGPGGVQLEASEQIADTSIVTFNSALGTATLDINNMTETVRSLAGNGMITLGTSGSGQLIFGGLGDSSTFAGTIGGQGSIVKTGSGVYTLGGLNTFSGGAAVRGGTLAFSQTPPGFSSGTLAGGNWAVYGGATLNFPSSAFVFTNGANLLLSGANPAFPAIFNLGANSGTFSIANGAQFSAFSMDNSGTINVGTGAASILTINGLVSQLSGSTLTGGTWNILSGGTITITDPPQASITTLLAGAAVKLSTSSAVFTPIETLTDNQGSFAITDGASFSAPSSFTNDGTLNVANAGATFQATGGVISSATPALGTTNVGAGGILKSPFVRQNALIVGGTVQLQPKSAGGAISTLNSLTFAGSPGAWTGILDVADNSLLINYSGPSPAATITNQLKEGYGVSGRWNGTGGIISSVAQQDASHFTLGYADGADHVVANLAAGQVLVQYARAGDANLDGVVNVVDLGILATHYGHSGTWDQGDYNYDGVVNVVDLGILATNYGHGTSLTASQAALQFQEDLTRFPQLQAIPEPASAALLAVSGMLLLVRRCKQIVAGV